MSGKRSSRSGKNWRAANLVDALMTDRGWYAVDVENASGEVGSGHPMRQVSRRTVYRVLNEGYVPSRPMQFEIAAVFSLLPSHVWGSASLPSEYLHLSDAVAA